VSTGTDEQAHSLRNQIDYYTGFIGGIPLWSYVAGYTDEALSGTSVAKRESFLKMIEDAKRDRFDFIVTKEISRFSRNTLDSIRYTQELLAAGVGVLFQSDNINTLMPDSELRLTIMSSIAQDEVRKISERVKFGFKRAIEKGTVLGNGNIWGYTKEKGKLTVDEREADIVRAIFMQYATQGKGIRAICAWLDGQGIKNGKGNTFSFSTVKGILANPKYMGYYCGNKTHKYDYKLNDVKYLDESEWVMYKDEANVPPIVSEELWHRANTILKERSAKQSSGDKTSYTNKYTYSGKIFCAEHNSPFYRAIYRYKSGDKEVWQCREYSAKGKAGCDSPTFYTTEADILARQACNAVIGDKSPLVFDLSAIYAAVGDKPGTNGSIAKIKAQITDITKRKDKLLDLNIKGHLDDVEFSERNRRFNVEIKNLETQLTALTNHVKRAHKSTPAPEALKEMIEAELNFNDSFEGALIDALIDRIYVHKTKRKNEITVKVHSKVKGEVTDYTITRNTRGANPSVCSVSSI